MGLGSASVHFIRQCSIAHLQPTIFEIGFHTCAVTCSSALDISVCFDSFCLKSKPIFCHVKLVLANGSL